MYDVLILGGGPAGYTAALYCARAGLQACVLETFAPGGQMGTTDTIENYPGFPDGVSGFDLAQSMQKQAERFGAKTVLDSVETVDLKGSVKRVTGQSGETYEAKTVILATGAAPRELGLPNEQSLRGKGVSYCATCDGMFYRGKDVIVVGGGNTAAADAIYLSKLCKSVTLVHRRDKLRASGEYKRPLASAQNIRIIWDSVVVAIEGDPVTGVQLKNVKTGELQAVPCSGVFVAIGNVPNTSLLIDQVALTGNGYIDADEDTCTSIPGVFAAGDVRRKPLRQVVTAVADGAVAAHMAEEYLSSQ